MMCSKRFLIVVMLAAMVVGGTAYATETYFGAFTDHDFFVAGNWTGGLPDASNDGILNSGPDYYAVIYDTPGEGVYTINRLQLGIYDNDHKMTTLTMEAGGLYIPYRLIVGGLFTNGRGTLNMDGGGIAALECWVGITDTGIVNMNSAGATLDTWGSFNVGAAGYAGSGTINLNNGLVKTSRLFMGNSNQSIVITDGTLDVTNAFCDYDIQNVLDYIANGWIVAGNSYVLQTEIYTNDCSGQGIRVTAEWVWTKGDLDGDGDVDMEDFAILAANWLFGT
jgi:hypothetical protein